MSRAAAKIHIAKKELGLHDDDYRDILERCTGRRSSAGMNDRQVGAVLDEFKRLGWKPKVISGSQQTGKKSNIADFDAAKKARALWISLWQLGAIRDKSEQALEAFAKRQLKVDAFKWANQQDAYKVIEALKSMAARNGWPSHAGQSQIVIKQNLIIAQCQKLGIAQPIGFLNMASDELTKKAQELGNIIQKR